MCDIVTATQAYLCDSVTDTQHVDTHVGSVRNPGYADLPQCVLQLFESLLIDHDPGVNYSNWNYFAGIGNDPRNRIFKTVGQVGTPITVPVQGPKCHF